MRFAAFGIVSKLHDKFPRLKIAIIKRAYWKTPPDPKQCFCSNPENSWSQLPKAVLQSIEELLLYVHESDEISKQIEPENERKDIPKRIKFYAKVDIEVLAAVMSTVHTYKNKPPLDEVRKAMLKAASKRMLEIKYCSTKPPPQPPPFISWFGANDLLDLDAVAAETTAAQKPTTSDETKAKVAVLEFDEKTGQLLNQQVSFEKADVRNKATSIEIPWKGWHEANLNMAAITADKTAIVMMLETIHRRWDVSAVNVQMKMNSAGKISLVAGANMPAKS